MKRTGNGVGDRVGNSVGVVVGAVGVVVGGPVASTRVSKQRTATTKHIHKLVLPFWFFLTEPVPSHPYPHARM